jgi:hypothetical protein
LREKEDAKQTATATPTTTPKPRSTTTKLNLFTRRTTSPTTTRPPTTTFKAKSLADLFIHRDGKNPNSPKRKETEQDNSVNPEIETTTKKKLDRETTRSRPRSKQLSKFVPKADRVKAVIQDDVSAFLPPGFNKPKSSDRATKQEDPRNVKETNRISTNFENRFTPTRGGKGGIPIRNDDVSKLVPEGFKYRPKPK